MNEKTQNETKKTQNETKKHKMKLKNTKKFNLCFLML